MPGELALTLQKSGYLFSLYLRISLGYITIVSFLICILSANSCFSAFISIFINSLQWMYTAQKTMTEVITPGFNCLSGKVWEKGYEKKLRKDCGRQHLEGIYCLSCHSAEFFASQSVMKNAVCASMTKHYLIIFTSSYISSLHWRNLIIDLVFNLNIKLPKNT